MIQVSNLDLLYLQAMNRLRKAYLEVVPGVAPFLSTASHDDIASLHTTFGIQIRPNPIVPLFTTTPAVVIFRAGGIEASWRRSAGHGDLTRVAPVLGDHWEERSLIQAE